uniref:LIM zinc-binding domain-containing protein n=1 Tax=Macaca mulatta TaxID=9544 RepID=A0A5F8A7I1_MACMU
MEYSSALRGSLQTGGLRPGSLDAEIDLLSSTLAELKGGRGHAPLRPDQQAEPRPPASRPGSLKPNPAWRSPRLPMGPHCSLLCCRQPPRPAFPVQAKVAQSVRGCGPPRRGTSQASGPLPGPHFLSQAKVKSGGLAIGARESQGQGPKRKLRGSLAPQEEEEDASTAPGAPEPPREDELVRLSKKQVHDMNHPPSWEYFGQCGGCGDVVGDGAGVVALDCVFHVGCFVCSTCRAQLRGQHFYAMERGRVARAATWPPGRNVPRAPSPPWTGSCGLWGRTTTPAASPTPRRHPLHGGHYQPDPLH